MTHPKEAMRYLSNLLWCAADNEGLESDFAGTAAMALDRLAPMLTARADADAREAALQYLSDTGQLMDRIAAMEADKAAAGFVRATLAADAAEQELFVGTDNKLGGQLGGEFIVKALKAGDEVAIIRGAAGDPVHNLREGGAKEAMEKAGLKVVMNRCPKIEHSRLAGTIEWHGIASGVVSSRKRAL